MKTTLSTRVLLVEDDENLGGLLKDYLIVKGYDATLAADGNKGYKAFMQDKFDICILDIMMPHKDGISLAKDIRAINSEIPIIFLTARSMQDDIIDGFRAGADDYLKKPFNMEELIFRIEAILKRSLRKTELVNQEFSFGKYVFNPNNRLLYFDGEPQKLTTKESELLKLLFMYKNDVLERNYALQQIWGDDTYFNARSMDVYITKLRKLLNKEPSIEIINIHGKGFKLILPEV